MAFDMLNFVLDTEDPLLKPLEVEQEAFTEYISKCHPYLALPQVQSERKTFHDITAFIGDDTAVVTDEPLLAFGMLYTSERLLGVKISWEDVGLTEDLVNYAEDWHIMPPNIWSSFDGVNMYSRNDAVSIILDAVKLKNLSPVRKQSNKETDLGSKFLSLAASANWTDAYWMSYDFHQLGLILGLVLFDFEYEIEFPFLYQTEGGCGGKPPWNSVYTAESALFYFNRGTSRAGILGVMRESIAINSGIMEPKDSIFARFSHLAASGDPIWKSQMVHLKGALNMGLSLSEAREVAGYPPLPSYLEPIAIKISAEKSFSAPVLSMLHKDGLITTEIDARLTEVSLERLRALQREQPISDYLREEDEKRKLIKSRSLKMLSATFPTGVVDSDRPDDETALSILAHYYRQRDDQFSFRTVMGYSDETTIFVTAELQAVIGSGSSEILKRSLLGGAEKLTYNYKRAEDAQELVQWLRDFSEGKENDIPPIALDDARILHQVRVSERETHIILVTSDRMLAKAAKGLANDGDKTISVITSDEFIELCFLDYMKAKSSRKRTSTFEFFNVFEQKTVAMQSETLQLLKRKALPWRMDRDVKCTILYDIPNIDRKLCRVWVSQSGDLHMERNFGCLLRKTVMQEDFLDHCLWERPAAFLITGPRHARSRKIR